MRLLLDEDVPVQLVEPLRRLLPQHRVDHAEQLGWKGKKDRFLLPDAARRQYDALLTNDSRQLDIPEETRAIRRSGMHHIRYDMRAGLDGLALAIGAVTAAIRPVMEELDQVNGQRLVKIQSIAPGKRYAIVDPSVAPPPYWRGGRGRRSVRTARPGDRR